MCSLFFTDYHEALVETLAYLLNKKDGKVYIAAPERGTTMQRFIEKAQKHFSVEVDQC